MAAVREGVFTNPDFLLRKGSPELVFLENGDRQDL
jgi:hypothetical protein